MVGNKNSQPSGRLSRAIRSHMPACFMGWGDYEAEKGKSRAGKSENVRPTGLCRPTFDLIAQSLGTSYPAVECVSQGKLYAVKPRSAVVLHESNIEM